MKNTELEFEFSQVVASKRSVREPIIAAAKVASEHGGPELPAPPREVEERAETVRDRGGHSRRGDRAAEDS